MKHKSIIKLNLIRATMTLALMMTCAMAWADNDPVSYIDADGMTQTCTDYTVLKGNEDQIGTSNQETWYVVDTTLNYQKTIRIKKDGLVHLILKDGAVMNVGTAGTPINGNGIQISGHTLIYGQSTGENKGQLNVYSNRYGIYASSSNVTINGGQVTAYGNNSGIFAFSDGASSNVTINGGQVTAYGKSYGIYTNDGNVTINGGQVTAYGNEYGIHTDRGSIFLGWTNLTDYIYASKYVGTCSLTDTFIDEDGTLHTPSNIGTINCKMLYPYIEGSVPYLDENGQRQLRLVGEYNTLSGNEDTLNTGWYVAEGTLTYSQTITLNGDVHLILKDNAVINIGTAGTPIDGDGSNANHFSIYAQSKGGSKGQLHVNVDTSSSYSRKGIAAEGGSITINGGEVSASGYYGIYGISTSVNINDGQVTANGSGYGIYVTNNHLTINGGQVTANGNDFLYGICCLDDYSSVTLGWTNPTDFIHVSRYSVDGTINIAEGKTFIDEDGNTYSGTLSSEQITAIAGKTLYSPYIEGSVPYLDENGQPQLCVGYTTLTSGMTTLGTAGQETWYVMDGTINFNQAIDIVGKIHLILKDGAVMNVGTAGTPINGNGIQISGHTLIYGQSTGGNKGQLNVYSDRNYCINVNSGSVTINGGQVTANGSEYGINASSGSTVTINGGQVSATGTNYGIYALNSNITLSWTNPTDYIYANSYFTNGTLSLTKTFIDEDGNLHTPSNIGTINGKTLYPDCVIMKHITGYGEGSGAWVFIASPVQDSLAPTEVHNLLGQKISTDPEPALYDFDLYRLNPSTTTWENYHAHTAGFNLVNGMGYLYASKENRTLVFAGTYNTDGSKQVTLQQGWNLVGNPFNASATVNRSYYRMNEGGTAIEAVDITQNNSPIDVCTGIVVKPETTVQDPAITFTKVSTQQNANNNNGGLQIALSQVTEPNPSLRGTKQSSTLDNAIVSFNEGSQLGKFYFGTQNANLYIPQGTEEYAIACSNGQGEMPVNFRAKENGTYTITMNPEGVEMAYLHLIDNMTGADVDLLAPNGGDARHCVSTYTFTAKTTDYESRFKLVFCTGVNNDSDSFAFFSNGNWIIANDGQATLQVIDVNGRILSSESINGNVSKAINQPAGVYVIRLINGENVKVQKIVVR